MSKKKHITESLTPRVVGYNVEIKKFSKSKDKKFKNIVGLCEFNEKRIYINKDLPDISYGSKKLCLSHELVHVRLKNILYLHDICAHSEERYVECEAICWTADKYLSMGEIEVKRYVTDGFRLSIRKKGHRKEIILRIFRFLKISPPRGIINKISGSIKEGEE